MRREALGQQLHIAERLSALHQQHLELCWSLNASLAAVAHCCPHGSGLGTVVVSAGRVTQVQGKGHCQTLCSIAV